MKFPQILENPVLKSALDFAVRAHGDQKYGDQPYRVHLLRVAEILAEETLPEDFESPLEGDEERNGLGWQAEHVFAAAILHDTLEDTNASMCDMIDIFGGYTTDIVEALTKEDDLCRKCAARRNFRGLQNNKWARRIKLCDRIANMEASRKDPGHKLSMYLKEFPAFKEALYEEEDKTYWRRLEALFQGHTTRAYLQTPEGPRYIGTQALYSVPFTRDPSLPREGRGDGAAEIIAEDLRRIQGAGKP